MDREAQRRAEDAAVAENVLGMASAFMPALAPLVDDGIQAQRAYEREWAQQRGVDTYTAAPSSPMAAEVEQLVRMSTAPIFGSYSVPRSSSYTLRQCLGPRIAHQVAHDIHRRIGRRVKRKFEVTDKDTGNVLFTIRGFRGRFKLRAAGERIEATATLQRGDVVYRILPYVDEEARPAHEVILQRERRRGKEFWYLTSNNVSRPPLFMRHGRIAQMQGMQQTDIATYEARTVTLHSHYTFTVESGEDVGLVAMLIVCKNELRAQLERIHRRSDVDDD